jgi:quinohemoprotein ethanol dehydrogenase
MHRTVFLSVSLALCVGLLVITAASSASGDTPAAAHSKTAMAAVRAITPAPAFTPDQLSAFPGNDWLVVHGDLASHNYSSLNQITTSNVSTLKLAWSSHLGGTCTAVSNNQACAAEGNALVYQGVMYLEDGAGDTSAIDATTGAHIWDYHPVYDPAFTKRGDVTRGIAMAQGVIFIPRMDGSVVALDQMMGGVVWQSSLGDWRQGYKVTAAPVYYDGMVLIGISGGDQGNSDYMSALDATSGRLLWHWNVIPHQGEPGYNTWGSKSAFHYAGGAIWNSVAVDPKLDLVYFGTGNQVPWNTRPPGQELWSNSIMALNAHTGKLVWGYQTVHHDVWDDDVPASVVLYDAAYRPYKILKSGTWVDDPAKGFSGSHAVGVKVKYTGKAVMQPALAVASKMGYVFILNRKTGKPLVPTPEMKVDQTGGAGLNLSPTQPIPLGDYFTSQCVLPSQWTALGPDAKPVQHGCTYTPVGFDHFTAIPHDEGEWMPSAYNPQTHQLYICTIDNRAWAMEAIPAAQQAAVLKPGASYTGIQLTQGLREGYTGGFTAMNLLTNKIAWRQSWPDFCYSGATATAGGLVFTGHNDGRLEAIDTSTGKSLWNSPPSEAAANAPVITYSVNGKQYVSSFVGGDAHEQTTRGDVINTYELP